MATVPVIRTTVTALQLAATVSFHGWSGWIPSMQAQLDRFVRQGGIGSGVQQTATLGRLVAITGWRVEDTLATALANIALWESFEGLVCAVNDPWLRSLPRVRFTDCCAGPPRMGKGQLADSGSQGIYLVPYSATAERLSDTAS